ncbi:MULTISPECIES: hypothetical protein [unclassified Luteimonas]
MNLRLIIGIGLLCISMPALAAKQPLPLPLAGELGVELVQEQQELAVDVPDSSGAAMQFGLLGALIGSAIESTQVKNAERRVAELRNLLVDYPFQARMEAALRERLPSEGISPSPVFELRATPWLAADATGTLSEPVERLVLMPRYAMRNDFELMSVALTASFAVREPRANGKIKVRTPFFRRYAFHFPLDDIGLDADGDAGRWLEMGAPRLEAMLDRGIDHVVDMLVYDLSAEGRAEAEAKVKRESARARGLEFNGRGLREGDGWAWVRSGNGIAQSLSGFEPIGNVPSATEATLIAARSQPAEAVDTEVQADVSAVGAVAEDGPGAGLAVGDAGSADPIESPPGSPDASRIVDATVDTVVQGETGDDTVPAVAATHDGQSAHDDAGPGDSVPTTGNDTTEASGN